MKKEEVRSLGLDSFYEFHMYYGDSKTGSILEKEGKYYFFTKKNFSRANAELQSFIEFGEEINLDAISSFERFWEEPISIKHIWPSEPVKQKVFNANRMIVLGAGASAGFSTQEMEFPKRPPLTFELFHDEYEDLLAEFPGARLLSSLPVEGENLENFFQKKWEFLKKHYDPDSVTQIINTQFYLQYLFKKVNDNFKGIRKNNYNILCDLISKYCVSNRKQMLVSSFNYDTLFEQSLENSKGYEYNDISDYIDEKRQVLLFKPHGSWNWVRYYRGIISPQQITNEFFSRSFYKSKLDYNRIFKDLEENISVTTNMSFANNDMLNNKPFLPQLLIPFTDKDEFVMPVEHRAALSNNLSKIEEILVIGWKGTEKVFQNLLKTHLSLKTVKIYVVNLKDDSIEKTFSDTLPNAEWHFYNSFSEFMRDCRNDNHPFFS